MGNKGILEVRTMGEFSVSWNNKKISNGARGADSQFVRLLQILFHYHDQGVERHRLQELLFEDSGSDDVHHLLRSVIYNTKKKLKSEGLPDVNYIVYRDGSYCWTDEIPVHEDAEQFEMLCEEAKAESDSERKMIKLIRACHSYSGEFLPHQTGLNWVAREDLRYKTMFKDIVNVTADELRKRQRYSEMEELGKHATLYCPLNDMEVITMEALISMGRYREAQKHYDETANLYQRELGIIASGNLMNKLDEFAGRFNQLRNIPELIASQLNEEVEDAPKGGYLCTYPVFKGIAQTVKRNEDRTAKSFLMICTLNERTKGKLKGDKAMDRLYDRMEETICGSVRKGDAVCRYGKGQYAVIMMFIDRDGCDVVRDRINRNFSLKCKDCAIDYYIEQL